MPLDVSSINEVSSKFRPYFTKILFSPLGTQKMQKLYRNAFLALSAARFLPPKNFTSSEGSDDYRDSSLELRYLPLLSSLTLKLLN